MGHPALRMTVMLVVVMMRVQMESWAGVQRKWDAVWVALGASGSFAQGHAQDDTPLSFVAGETFAKY